MSRATEGRTAPGPAIGAGFTLLAAGDLVASRPLAARLAHDAAFSDVARLLGRATLVVGNVETAIVDMRTFGGHPRTVDDWCMAALPAVAGDLADLGLRLVSRANNHCCDWGIEGMRETGRHLDAAGIVHAGAGETLAHARAPRYVETEHGRVGLVSACAAQKWDNDAALDQFGEVPARPGLSALRIALTATAPKPVVDGLRDVYRKAHPGAADPGDGELTIFDTTFIEGEATAVRWAPDRADVAEVLRSVRLGAQHSDLLVVSLHVHEEEGSPAQPPAFLVELAHAAVDAGAGAVFGHGSHVLGPVEIYNGRLICYGLGNFIWSDIVEFLHGALHVTARERYGARLGDPERITDAEVNRVFNASEFADSRYFESVLVELTCAGGEPVVRLHPIDLRYGTPLTESGVPRFAGPELGRAILERLDALSRPFGTAVELRDGVVGHAVPSRERGAS
jgi:poly-gamma-glutamate capsule biosynthesis protein CapA/YwtB (metallophosphatase superfamily)